MKVFFQAFFWSQLDFVIFWQKFISEKAACKMLMKLATGQKRKHVQAQLLSYNGCRRFREKLRDDYLL